MQKEIEIPYNFTPRDYQLPLIEALDNGCKRAVAIYHRRAGKDKTCFNYMIKRALEEKGNYFYFLPTYTLAKKVIWDNIDSDGFRTLDHAPDDVCVQKNASELKIELLNGSIIQLIGADKFDTNAIGTNPRGVVFSEYSVTNPHAWEYVKPILRMNKGWAVFIYTPRGLNHGWKLLQLGERNKTWFTQVLTIDDTKLLTKQDMDEERAEGTPEDMIDQEYYCKFVEGASQFFRNLDERLWKGKDQIPKDKQYQIGVDLAKYQDFTVLTAIDLHTFEVHKQERFNQLDWKTQSASIEAFIRRYNNGRAFVDATGVGDPIVEQLMDMNLDVVPYKFTEQSRKDLLHNLRILLEQNSIKIPDDEMLLTELRSFQTERTEQGRLKIQVPDGMHDDMVFSLALAVWDIGIPRAYAGVGMSLGRLSAMVDGHYQPNVADNE